MKKINLKAVSIMLVLAMFACLVSACGKADPSDTPEPASTATVPATEVPSITEAPSFTEDPAVSGLTDEQKASMAMLNYLAYTVQQINASRHSRVALEEAFDGLLNDIEPSGVDDTTRQAFQNIFETIKQYRMNSFGYERLEYINDQGSAQTVLSIVPNPSELLDLFKENKKLAPLAIAAKVADSAMDLVSDSSYTSSEEIAYLERQWDLDDAEERALMDSRTNMFDYMVQIAQGLPKGSTLSENDIAEFVTQTTQSSGAAKLDWLKNNREKYQYFGYYWLELANSCYENSEYVDCLSAIETYRANDTGIFKLDKRLAQSMTFAVMAAKETMSGGEYEAAAADFADVISTNIGTKDWELRYYAALVYLDLYNQSSNTVYLEKAYNETKTNVRNLIPEQKEQNTSYLGDVVEVQAGENADKEELGIVSAFNKFLKNNRKTELPPVYEPLLRNCELLFALAEELNIQDSEKKIIDSMLHDQSVFLSRELDSLYTFDESAVTVALSEDNWSYSSVLDSQKFTLPVVFTPAGTTITGEIVNGGEQIALSNWTVNEVDRNNSTNVDDYEAVFTCKAGKTIFFKEGDTVTLQITPPGAVSELSTMTVKLVVDQANIFGVHFKLVTDD